MFPKIFPNLQEKRGGNELSVEATFEKYMSISYTSFLIFKFHRIWWNFNLVL